MRKLALLLAIDRHQCTDNTIDLIRDRLVVVSWLNLAVSDMGLREMGLALVHEYTGVSLFLIQDMPSGPFILTNNWVEEWLEVEMTPAFVSAKGLSYAFVSAFYSWIMICAFDSA